MDDDWLIVVLSGHCETRTTGHKPRRLSWGLQRFVMFLRLLLRPQFVLWGRITSKQLLWLLKAPQCCFHSAALLKQRLLRVQGEWLYGCLLPRLKLRGRYLNLSWVVFKMWRVSYAEDTCPGFPQGIVWTLWTFVASIYRQQSFPSNL